MIIIWWRLSKAAVLAVWLRIMMAPSLDFTALTEWTSGYFLWHPTSSTPYKNRQIMQEWLTTFNWLAPTKLHVEDSFLPAVLFPFFKLCLQSVLYFSPRKCLNLSSWQSRAILLYMGSQQLLCMSILKVSKSERSQLSKCLHRCE